jgi:hypothetical protein
MLSIAHRFAILRGLVVAIVLAGCEGPDKFEKAELVPVSPHDFEYHVMTDLFYPPGADTVAERYRLQWLASDLAFAKFCPANYELLSRQVIFQYQAPLDYPVDEIIYRGRCRV